MVRLVRRLGGPDDLWQIGLLRDRGYHGPIHMPLAGRGVLPADLAAATAAALDGTADCDGSLERGLFYPDQLRAIAGATDASTLFADVTGVGDATAVVGPGAGPAAGHLPGDGRVAPVARRSVRRHLVRDALDRRQRPRGRPACHR